MILFWQFDTGAIVSLVMGVITCQQSTVSCLHDGRAFWGFLCPLFFLFAQVPLDFGV